MGLTVRRMQHSDIDSVKRLIDKVLSHKSMLKVYEASEIAIWDTAYDAQSLAQIIETAHAYVLVEEVSGRLLASGYIKRNDGGDSAHIGMVFTDHEYQRMGLGKKIVEALERDEIAGSVNRIELNSSLSAYRFYQKMGYDCKDHEYQIGIDMTHVVPMEKILVHSTPRI